ncbi:MAG TPA: metallophosphoesterase [Verrucomicrobiota bacterium]|nr:metallophosphoesterase [Verrucomicrobiota bacterium]
MNLPTFDQLHVISDLHLGGAKGRQIFTSTREARGFLKHLSAIADAQVGLVINGDLVDFLAEDNAQCFDTDPDRAETKLRNIAGRDAFKPVFEGLREFVAAANHHLAINLGNHDLEFALPWVRRTLLDLLSGGEDSARGRIALTLDGSGYRAQVGRARVICLHGNEVDPWNVTDYEKLRCLGRDLSLGKSVEPWKPNAGSRMVIEVMNGIKADWPFVDLLKPETKAVPLILLALNPQLAWKVKEIATLFAAAKTTAAKREAGFLGELGWTPVGAPVNLLAADEARLLRKLGQPSGSGPQIGLLDGIERQFRSGVEPVELLGMDHDAAYLGKLNDFWAATTGWLHQTGADLKAWLNGKGRLVLRKSLECLVEDRIFDLSDASDTTYRETDEKVGPEFNFVITGHTHLERALRRQNGGGFFYNSGTWAGIMRLERHVLENESEFTTLYRHLEAGSLEVLEKNDLVMRHNTVVSITAGAGGSAHGTLRHIKLNKSGKLAPETVAGSESDVA